ncbi:MAG: DUF362 domain-containing protein [bacterium]|nr:DUF362 domain-containing protein [bacterium]
MSTKINRRNFLKSGAFIAAASLFTSPGKENSLYAAKKGSPIDISVAESTDRFKNTKRALDGLGGMKKFISKNSSVGLICNSPSWWKNPGSFTHPEVVLAAILMCKEAGAKEIRFLINPATDFWSRTPIADKYKKETAAVKQCSGNFIEKAVPKGIALKNVQIIKDLFDCDAYINLPIIKHHTGTHMTCNLKNMMGASSYQSNKFFHHGSGATDSYGDVDFLSQCIADLNTLRKPSLCIVDASEVLITNGPAGPGKKSKLNKVVAGSDPVAVDAYCATLLGLNPKDISMITKAHAHGLGNIALDKLTVKEYLKE